MNERKISTLKKNKIDRATALVTKNEYRLQHKQDIPILVYKITVKILLPYFKKNVN